MIDNLQLAMAILIAAIYGVAYFIGHRRIHLAAAQADATAAASRIPPSMGIPARTLVGIATVLVLALLAWRAAAGQTLSLPLSDHLDAFLVLALLLAIVLMYFRWTRHLGGLSFYILPMIVIVLVLGTVLKIAYPDKHLDYDNIWLRIHLATVIAGSACFALACVCGIVYLAAARQLKQKNLVSTSRRIMFPPLASMEKFNQWMVYLGFPLLTVAMVTGIVRMRDWTDPMHWHAWPKIAMAVLAWIIYAMLLPLAPSIRGRRAAWLSIAGFIFVLGAYVAANWIK